MEPICDRQQAVDIERKKKARAMLINPAESYYLSLEVITPKKAKECLTI